MRISYRLPTLADADTLAPRLRSSDVEELSAAFGPGRERELLAQSISSASYCRVMLLDGDPISIHGVSPVLARRVGAIWQLGAPEMEQYPREQIGPTARNFVADSLKVYGLLFNYVHAKNTKSIRWLRRLGFTIQPATPYGIAQDFFHPFYMTRQQCA